jgi:hypothetical protein
MAVGDCRLIDRQTHASKRQSAWHAANDKESAIALKRIHLRQSGSKPALL